ncbi:hypothetical protein ACI2KH_20980, partial [Roseomonas mucosa]|uniref:hypothetical protein n=1 Tax=Roseomonas mucosa TaxID=207340 RepID=UPI00384EDA10
SGVNSRRVLLIGHLPRSQGAYSGVSINSKEDHYGHFRPRRHLMTAAQHRRACAKASRIWREETCVQTAA